MSSGSPYLLPLAANAMVCIVGIGLAIAAMLRARRLLLLPLSLLVFLVTVGLTQGLPLLLPVAVFPTEPVVYARAALCDSILVGVASLPLIVLASVGRRALGDVPFGVPAWLPFGLTAYAAAALAYMVVRNPGIVSLSTAIYRADSYYTYIEARNALGDYLNGRTASGQGLVNLAFAFCGPTALILLPHVSALGARVRRLLMFLVWILMLAPALLGGSRMELTFVIFYPLALLLLRRADVRSLMARLRLVWRKAVIAVAIVGGAVGVFQFAFQSTTLVAAGGFLARVFVSPGGVSDGYYLTFPDPFAFRGVLGIFMMPVPSDVVDFSMVSIAGTGLDSHANGSFLATAYSGAGYWGALAASVVLVAGAVLVDLLLLRLPRRLGGLLTFANIFAIVNIVSIPFLICVVTYGYIIGPLGILMVLAAARQLRTEPSVDPSVSPVPI
ncbi:MAG: hypothetical protein ABR998_12445 [Gemmatimonadales bacterium]|jgi:hypothetical protein